MSFAMKVDERLVFNFSASYSGGGLKRLQEFARWFDAEGGAHFLVHPASVASLRSFSRNRYTVISWPRLARLFSQTGYLRKLEPRLRETRLYYSYGIPLARRMPGLNWLHVSNVLPFAPLPAGLSVCNKLTQSLLGRRLRASFGFADVISAESHFSLGLLPASEGSKFVASPNGSDDELEDFGKPRRPVGEPVATVVGTVAYKTLADSWRVFLHLRQAHPTLTLKIIGDPRAIPRRIRRQRCVATLGILPRSEVIAALRASRFYITTTCIENSFNAAAEGVFCATESYISDIGPHRELLAGQACEEVAIPGIRGRLLHVYRERLTTANLRSWNEVIGEILAKVQSKLDS